MADPAPVGRLRVKGSTYYDLQKIKRGAPSMAEGSVPNFNDITRDILALNTLPERRITPTLLAGVEPGTVDIELQVEDKLPLHGSVELNNRHSIFTSDLRLNGSLSYANLWQLGSGIAPFDRLVDQVMSQAPYKVARRVFWIVDNGSSHRGESSRQRLHARHPRLVLVHGPIHASWLNQIEIYFSIIQRKVLTPNDFSSLKAVRQRLEDFERHYEAIAKPFRWKFTRRDLTSLCQKIETPQRLAA